MKIPIILILATLILLVGCEECMEKNQECCKGDDCKALALECGPEDEAAFQGCTDTCMPEWKCRENLESCQEIDGSCCRGEDCSLVVAECGTGDTMNFKGCDENCNPIMTCVTA